MKEKSLLVIIVFMLIVSIGHNAYLNYELFQVKKIASETHDAASAAEIHAIEASAAAYEASELAEEAI